MFLRRRFLLLLSDRFIRVIFCSSFIRCFAISMILCFYFVWYRPYIYFYDVVQICHMSTMCVCVCVESNWTHLQAFFSKLWHNERVVCLNPVNNAASAGIFPFSMIKVLFCWYVYCGMCVCMCYYCLAFRFILYCHILLSTLYGRHTQFSIYCCLFISFSGGNLSQIQRLRHWYFSCSEGSWKDLPHDKHASCT